MTKVLILEQLSEPLVNYLRVHRRKAALTQYELGQLLGYRTEIAVSRHERFEAIPPLLMALGYEVLYGVSTSEIFPGLARTVETALEKRLAEFEDALRQRSARGARAEAIARKLAWLSERRSHRRKLATRSQAS